LLVDVEISRFEYRNLSERKEWHRAESPEAALTKLVPR